MKISATVILGLGGSAHIDEHIDGTIALLNSAPVTYLSTLQLHLDESITEEFQRKYGKPSEMPDDMEWGWCLQHSKYAEFGLRWRFTAPDFAAIRGAGQAQRARHIC